ncbi:methylated-DNA--[protein]-cysteine S-methyltransferase [Nioella nitratireducens]|uniref:methylated-DNA--[protein]-cysteine S-methyltransferase n=1 Tax=Nioella nitratireducens TaxID=1287720 RepID=UPI0008FD692B|nr:methylated-DNA--[protein]-cysteine S-methyltransferase [Nioella nitratireducens]
MTAGVDSPLGPLVLTEEGGAITALDWGACGTAPNSDVTRQAAGELAAYFAGRLTDFTVPLAPRGSGFQQAFYHALCAIPFGETRTYGDLAGALGVSAQAIGQACGANPIPVLIPCHRVLGATGLGGYSGAGGVETKLALLRLEGAGGFLL